MNAFAVSAQGMAVQPPQVSIAPRAAEFFAGIGLVRVALESAGFSVVFANDIEPFKASLYAAHLDVSDFLLGDIRSISGEQIPDIEIATASFPCTDMSTAGKRAGFAGNQSSLFWSFHRILAEMGSRRPRVVLLENVPGFAISNHGEDLRQAVLALNSLEYSCDLLVVNARRFLPQSRPRLFIVGAIDPPLSDPLIADDPLRPSWLQKPLNDPRLRLHRVALNLPPPDQRTLADIAERIDADSPQWWSTDRQCAFTRSLSLINRDRLASMMDSPNITWATACWRTRRGNKTWEIRAGAISGCLLRVSVARQAMVEAGNGSVRMRWMTPLEYARLQGADDFPVAHFPPNKVFFGFGDAVCVPVVAWLARAYLRPLVDASRSNA